MKAKRRLNKENVLKRALCARSIGMRDQREKSIFAVAVYEQGLIFHPASAAKTAKAALKYVCRE